MSDINKTTLYYVQAYPQFIYSFIYYTKTGSEGYITMWDMLTNPHHTHTETEVKFDTK